MTLSDTKHGPVEISITQEGDLVRLVLKREQNTQVKKIKFDMFLWELTRHIQTEHLIQAVDNLTQNKPTFLAQSDCPISPTGKHQHPDSQVNCKYCDMLWLGHICRLCQQQISAHGHSGEHCPGEELTEQ